MIPASFDIEVGLIVHEGRVDPTAFVPAGVAPGTPILYRVAGIDGGLVWLLPEDARGTSRTTHIDNLRADYTAVVPLDAGNYGLVSTNGETISVLNLGHLQDMTPDQALAVAAWLVCLADPLDDKFRRYLETVRAS